MRKSVQKIIITTSGLGERFKPFTDIVEKSCLPILKKPLIHYLVEEAIDCGIKDIVITINSKKSLVLKYIKKSSSLFLGAKIKFLVQKKPKGLLDALNVALKTLKNGSVGIILGDELIDFQKNNPMKKMIDLHNQNHKNIIGIQKMPRKELINYGVVDCIKNKLDNLWKVKKAIEKPKLKDITSNYGIIGRYVMNNEMINEIKSKNKCLESLTEAFEPFIKSENCLAYNIENKRFDIGSVKGFVKANFHFAKETKIIE